MTEKRYESSRGCGRRKIGGKYLVSSFEDIGDCGKLPIKQTICECCGNYNFVPSRAPTWKPQPESLWRNISCRQRKGATCLTCPMSNAYETGGALMVTVGEKFYPRPSDFLKEAVIMGFSRRIQSIPRQFKIGETWVLLVHPKGYHEPLRFGEEPKFTPAIFSMFKPTAIEVVVAKYTSTETIDAYKKRGLTPIIVKPLEEKSKEVLVAPS